jgi:hypothetical protein
MKRYVIEKLGGYPDIKAALYAIENRHIVLTEAVKHLFPIVSPEDVLRRDKTTGMLIFRGRQLTRAEEDMIRDEAVRFTDSKLWHILRTDIKYAIHKKMFEEANDEMGMMVGKLMLFYDYVIKTRIEMLIGKKS